MKARSVKRNFEGSNLFPGAGGGDAVVFADLNGDGKMDAALVDSSEYIFSWERDCRPFWAKLKAHVAAEGMTPAEAL